VIFVSGLLSTTQTTEALFVPGVLNSTVVKLQYVGSPKSCSK
jgi:hypothetical protein